MISVKTWLESVYDLSIGSSVFEGLLWVLVHLMLFLACFMCPFDVDMNGGSCFMSSTVMLGQVVKWLFLMSWINVFFT